uniref:Adenylate cyclase n=1 Tax=Opuntia streptacantha TaxID=393608 RepID=A0A7C8Z6I5_OPUST
MDQIATVGDEFYGHNNSSPFQALEGLSFKNMKAWEVWSNVDAKGNAVFFPLLQRLSLCDCPELKGGLPIHAPLLEEVEIKWCGQLSSLLCQREFRHDTLEVASPLRAEFRSEFDGAMIRTLILDGLAQLVQIPEELCRLSALQELRIASCESLKSLANAKLPPALQELRIASCKSLKSLANAKLPPQLEELRIEQWKFWNVFQMA